MMKNRKLYIKTKSDNLIMPLQLMYLEDVTKIKNLDKNKVYCYLFICPNLIDNKLVQCEECLVSNRNREHLKAYFNKPKTFEVWQNKCIALNSETLTLNSETNE